jgi:hypothetical protein
MTTGANADPLLQCSLCYGARKWRVFPVNTARNSCCSIDPVGCVDLWKCRERWLGSPNRDVQQALRRWS